MSRLSRCPSVAGVCVLAMVLATPASAAARAGEGSTWPTLHRDYQRSGHTDEVVEGPYERTWYRDFHDEMIATRCEAIVAGGKCFVGTFAGNVYALDVRDGKTLWTFRAAGPVGASPCWHGGRLYVGCDEAFDAGRLVCLDAADGSVVWEYRTGGGIWAAPACVGGRVYVGDRAGVFHAVNAADGKAVWTHETGGMILKPASFSPDGERIILGSEDMHVTCLSPAGKVLWRSRKLPGLSLRDQGATIWRGLAIVRTNPADAFHKVLRRNGEVLEAIQRALPESDEDKVLLDKWNDLLMHPTPRRRKAEIEGIVEYLREHRHDRCFFAFDFRDGSEPWIAPVFYTGGLHNPPTPPTFDPETGELYTFWRSALTYYLRGVRRYNSLCRLDRRTGRPDFVYPEQRHDAGRAWYGMPLIGDETQALSMMGPWLVVTHQGDIGALHTGTEKVMRIWRGRDSYGGIFGPKTVEGGFRGAKKLGAEGWLVGMPNEWHGPDRAIVAVAEGRLFWVVGSQVVCLAGPDVPKAPSGGTEPPPIIKRRTSATVGGNVASRGAGQFDEGVPAPTVPPAALAAMISPPPAERTHAGSDLARRLRARLDAEVAELVDAGPWAPLIVELGITGEERHFWRTAGQMQILALALPHLSPPVRAKAVEHLRGMLDAGCPLAEPTFPDDGARREPFTLGPGMKEFAVERIRYDAGLEDLYGLWAAGHYAGLWQPVLARADAVAKLVADARDLPGKFDHDDQQNDAAEHLNRQIAGALAAARILRRAGKPDPAAAAEELLEGLLAVRVHHELADTRLVRSSGRGIHGAKVPRYVGLVPELSAALHRLAEAPLKRNVTALRTGLPLWYQAWGERMIGGENYISPPHLSRAVFAALADGLAARPATLAARLDQPWCRADLYYIEKLSATLRRVDSATRQGD